MTDAVTVDASPLMNAVDTTNGYVLEKAQIEAIPLPTGSFTGVAGVDYFIYSRFNCRKGDET